MLADEHGEGTGGSLDESYSAEDNMKLIRHIDEDESEKRERRRK